MNFLLSIARLLDLAAVSTEVNDILNFWVGPLFIAIGGVGTIYVIILGIQYAKSESDSKRAEAKTRIINCIIGVIILLIIGAICLSVNWASLVEIFGYTKKG